MGARHLIQTFRRTQHARTRLALVVALVILGLLLVAEPLRIAITGP